jgi:hypothetical protein
MSLANSKPYWASLVFFSLHGVLAVKGASAGFRGINGALPAQAAGPLHLFHGPVACPLTAALAPCLRPATGNPAGMQVKENIMRSAIRTLNIKSAGGHIVPATDTFTSGFVRETAEGYTSVSDNTVIDTALQLLSRRVAKGPLLASPRAVKDYLRLRFADLQHEVFCLLYVDLCGAIIYVQCGAVAAVGARYPAVWST